MERVLIDAFTGKSGSTPKPFSAGAVGSFQCTGSIQRKTYLIEGKYSTYGKNAYACEYTHRQVRVNAHALLGRRSRQLPVYRQGHGSGGASGSGGARGALVCAATLQGLPPKRNVINVYTGVRA